MIKIKIIKDTEKCKVGEIVSASKKSAESYVKNGYAKYVEEPKKDGGGEKKSYYEIQLDALNCIKNLEDKRAYLDKIDLKHKIEKDSDAGIIKELNVLKDFIDQGILKEKKNPRTLLETIEKELQEGDNERFFSIQYSNKTGKEISRKVRINFVAEYLTLKHNFKTLYGEKTERIKLYDGRIYSKGAKGLIKSLCENILDKYCRKNVVEEIFDKIKRKTKTTEEEFYQTDLYLIPLENGCYNIKTKKLEEHSPKNNFTFLSPIKYNQKAKCKNWFKFIEEALYPKDIQVMKQWFGFNLFRQYFIKKAMILLGKQDTGKTVLLDVLIYFVGEKNKCGLSLQKISSGSDFTKFALKDKLANIYDDLSSADINDGGAFKIATGGGFISAEEKFGEFVQFKSFAKNTLAGNKAPAVKDNDDNAYFGRFMPIIFDNVPEKIDPFLRDKLTTDEELSGILNWALEGLHEILETGKFSFDKTNDEIKKIMEMSGDVLIQFGEEVLEKSEGKITKDDMYKVYCLWADENDKPILSKEQLGRRLNQKIKYLVAKHDAKIRYWDNVSLKQKWVKKSEKVLEKINSTHKNDTLDTFQNIMRNYCENDKNNTNNSKNKDNKNDIYKIEKSVETVTDSEEKNDTLDTISEEEIEEMEEMLK